MSKKVEFANLDLISALGTKDKEFNYINLSEIHLSPNQPRILKRDQVDDLVESMSRLGLIEPIIVRRDGSKFTIVAGERRYRAAKKLGWQDIKALVTEANPDKCFEIALAENEKRKSLNPWEVGKAIQFLRKEKKKTALEVSEMLGFTERYVKQLSSIARLEQKSILEFLTTGKDPSVKNLENLLKQKEGRGGGEIVSPSGKNKIVLNLASLNTKQKEDFLKELHSLKKRYNLI